VISAAPKAVPSVTASATPAGISAVKRWRVALGVLIAIAAVAAGMWFYSSRQAPSDSAIADYLAATVAPLPVRVVGIEVTPLQAGKATYTFSFRARIEITEPLYRKVDTAEYLRTHFGREIATIDAATALLNGANGARIRAALMAGPSAPGNGDATSSSRSAADSATGRSPLQFEPARPADGGHRGRIGSLYYRHSDWLAAGQQLEVYG
jgi:hypothetical protein